MQAHNVLKCSNLHLLFYFIYFHAFFTNHRTYMRRNSIFHTNICKAQQSPHSHLCCPVCHLAPFFFFFLVLSWLFLFLVQGSFAPSNCVQPTLLIVLPPHISISEALKWLQFSFCNYIYIFVPHLPLLEKI